MSRAQHDPTRTYCWALTLLPVLIDGSMVDMTQSTSHCSGRYLGLSERSKITRYISSSVCQLSVRSGRNGAENYRGTCLAGGMSAAQVEH